MPPIDEALRLATGFPASREEEKSRELILALLEQTPAPFSRDQFLPGHITCTALVLHPDAPRVLMVHHHRLRRWLLPGGHVEASDATLGGVAQREAVEETAVRIVPGCIARLAGMDVHGIPARKGEPFHLHHDLIFTLEAASSETTATWEAPEVAWFGLDELERNLVPSNIICAFRRVEVR